MNAIRHDSPELIRFWIDTTHLEPPSYALRTTADTLPRDARLDSQDVDTDLDEPFGENVGKFTTTEFVICEPPQVTHGHDASIVNGYPCAVVEMVHRPRHR